MAVLNTSSPSKLDSIKHADKLAIYLTSLINKTNTYFDNDVRGACEYQLYDQCVLIEGEYTTHHRPHYID